MNPLELRYEIFKKLVDLSDERDDVESPEMVNAALIQPEWSIRVVTKDPYDPDTIATRTFRVRVEEITDGGE